MYDALYNWGNALAYQAKTKTGESALKLEKLAEEKMTEYTKLTSKTQF
jgi:hypothetical protein